MKTTQELRRRWARQWESTQHRISRILEDGLPYSMKITAPSPKDISENSHLVGQVIADWNNVSGVSWGEKNYRALGKSTRVPMSWEIMTLQDWADACGVEEIANQMRTLELLLEQTSALYHEFLVQKKSAWSAFENPLESMLTAIEVAESLSRGCCSGNPLRSFPVAGHVGTKFIEQNEALIVSLLDLRFEGEVRELGLESFLNAANEGGHWVLLVDNSSNTLPVRKMRIRTCDLFKPFTEAHNILIIENEQCEHLLPELKDTLVISGAGRDLSWTASDWLQERTISYWGDLDTWGLAMLSSVRENLPQVNALLMTSDLLEVFSSQTTQEKQPYSGDSLDHLTPEERALFDYLKENGLRLEQECLSQEIVNSMFNPSKF